MVFMEDRYAHSILETCEKIHAHITGSSDELSGVFARELVRWLSRRFASWDATKESRYDYAVSMLVMATLAEARAHDL